MKKTLVMAVTLTLVCAAAWSQGPPGPGGPRGGRPMLSPAMAVMPPQPGMVGHLAETLGLTEDQTAKIEKITAENGDTVRSLSEKSADASKALHDALLAADFDAQKVKDLAAAAQKAEAAVVSASIDEWIQIRAILTTDQARGLLETMSMRGPGPGQRPAGPRGPGGPGAGPMSVSPGAPPPPPPPPGR